MVKEENNIESTTIIVTRSKRFVSAFIDYIPMMMCMLIANAIGMKMFHQSFDMDAFIAGNSMYATDAEVYTMTLEMFSALSVIIFPLTIGLGISYTYFLCKDIIGGQSIGKRIQKFQLVRLDGSPVSYTRMIIRNVFIIIWPVELVMYFMNSGQRLGDILCKTTVVAATEENKQITDIRKVIVCIIAVSIFSTLISFFYYKGMIVVFDWYIGFMENIFQRTTDNY
ncbi:MAG: RDD family protein [Dysgonomonas sp.]|nr:RDD family protein [Dysgonomonas sp.]